MAATDPLLGARRSMSHYSTLSESVQVTGGVGSSSRMSGVVEGREGDVERLTESLAQSSDMEEDSLRKRGISSPSTSSGADDFLRVEVRE